MTVNKEIQELIIKRVDNLSEQVAILREAVSNIALVTNTLLAKVKSYEEKIEGVNKAAEVIQNIIKATA
ncbi:MAG: hypothetical protein ACFE9L_03070 [Candidatus Hodarchaeota archaeon]